MTRTDKHQELRELIDVILDDEASDSEVKALEQQLSQNPEALAFYYEYISMHMHLKSAGDRNIEFVYRRMSEEFIVRPMEKSPKQIPTESITEPPIESIATRGDGDKSQQLHSDQQVNQNKFKTFKTIIYLLIALLFAALLILIVWYNNTEREEQAFTAKIVSGQLSILGFGKLENNYLSPGEYRVEQAAQLQLPEGDNLYLVTHSVIKIFNNNEIQLLRGKLNIDPVSEHNILVHGKNFALYTNGSELSVDLTANNPVIKSGLNTQLVPETWQPRHFWSFDGSTERAIDSAGNADGIVSQGAKRVKGLIGQGAFLFNNTSEARLNAGNGGGVAPASGSFAVRDGITIEALIVPNYAGDPDDDDHIFRKDQSDGNLRILLSFQNDKGKDYIRPRGEFDESISFGLFLLGQGYQELKLPLDGKQGRPTLADLKDGEIHHLVATYDAASGYKMIYLDGIKLASFRYPMGSKILSGGKGMAHIGNNPNASSNEKEAFNGVIDEVAFYDFALPPYMVKNHFLQIKNRLNYFGLFPSTEPLPQVIKIPLPANTYLEIDALTGLPFGLLNQ